MRSQPAPRPLGGISGERLGNGHTTATRYDVGAQGADPRTWLATHRDDLRAELGRESMVLIRGLPVDIPLFHDVVTDLGGTLLEYAERSTPRTAVSGNIYTSTDYPADQTIPMHNESSYASSWPHRLFFSCHTAPGTGGATPIADSRAVLALIPEDVRDRFADGVRYTRTYHPDLDLPWQEAFQTGDRDTVTRYCHEHGIAASWPSPEILHTESHRPAVRPEPATGADVWFNQANLFHRSSLDPDVREALDDLYAEADLPRNVYFGDGSPIPDKDIDAITRAYDTAALAVPWQPGDIMIVNNMLAAHGRQPYTGERRILVAMT
jgi:alpha-ketoglutarate-dependent taurine dioxygenase